MRRKLQLQREIDKNLLVNEVLTDLTNGETTANVIRKLTGGMYETEHYKDKPMSVQWAYKILHAAMEESKSEMQQSRETLRSMMLNRYLSVYQQAVRDNDKSNAIRSLDSLCKLLGLNETPPTTAVQINSDKDKMLISFGFTNQDEQTNDSEL